MKAPIVPIAARPIAAAPDPKRTEKLHKAAKDFESLLVKQLLTAAHVAGDTKGSTGYADMAVDALASGIEKGGGLGLARRIEETISHSLRSTENGTKAALPPEGS